MKRPTTLWIVQLGTLLTIVESFVVTTTTTTTTKASTTLVSSTSLSSVRSSSTTLSRRHNKNNNNNNNKHYNYNYNNNNNVLSSSLEPHYFHYHPAAESSSSKSALNAYHYYNGGPTSAISSLLQLSATVAASSSISANDDSTSAAAAAAAAAAANKEVVPNVIAEIASEPKLLEVVDVKTGAPETTTATAPVVIQPASKKTAIAKKENDVDDNANVAPMLTKQYRKELIRKEGGLFSICTKYGGINLFSLYYAGVSIALGIPWYFSLLSYQLFQFFTRNQFDKNRKIPILLNQAWGVAVMILTNSIPQIENKHILDKFYKEKRCAMFVANHNSWLDIPCLGYTVGWRNYKIISKMELGRVPILGKAIRVAGNLLVDRSDRKSGLKTLKQGIQYLKDGIHLCTFPEGTRSRTGRLIPFKNGAFKMAHKAGAPVIPLSIVGADHVQPVHWIFPYRPAHKHIRVVVGEPIESIGKTEDELAIEVRNAIINGLPENQRPLK